MLADLDAHAMPAILDRSVDAGAVPRDIADGWLPMAACCNTTRTPNCATGRSGLRHDGR
jgi:hypothetical protein